jgi:hypothetical protein
MHPTAVVRVRLNGHVECPVKNAKLFRKGLPSGYVPGGSGTTIHKKHKITHTRTQNNTQHKITNIKFQPNKEPKVEYL